MLVDHHCHLDFPQFAKDRDGVVARAAGRRRVLVTISTRVRQLPDLIALAERYPNVFVQSARIRISP